MSAGTHELARLLIPQNEVNGLLDDLTSHGRYGDTYDADVYISPLLLHCSQTSLNSVLDGVKYHLEGHIDAGTPSNEARGEADFEKSAERHAAGSLTKLASAFVALRPDLPYSLIVLIDDHLFSHPGTGGLSTKYHLE